MKTITKVLCLLLCLTMSVGMIASCDSGNAGNPNSSQDSQTEEISKPSEESKDPEPGPIPTEGLSYTLLDDDTYEVSVGTATEEEEIIIPATYEGKAVTSIARQAFLGCENVTKISLPKSITNIEPYAFSSCKKLSEILVAKENTEFQSIDGNLYSKDGTCLIQYARGKSLTQFLVPDSVTTIGGYAFAPCNLSQLTITNSVTSIGEYAFEACNKLTDIYFTGTEEEWNTIEKSSAKIPSSATIHFN